MRTRQFAITVLAALSVSIVSAQSNDTRRKDLRNLVLHDCGACHGLTLKGGLGPALTPESLTGKDTLALAHTILSGRPGTPMPPWNFMLTDKEAEWIAGQLKQGSFLGD